eukprot:jgi/Botrbrau1/19853/Bobra.0124s0089.2
MDGMETAASTDKENHPVQEDPASVPADVPAETDPGDPTTKKSKKGRKRKLDGPVLPPEDMVALIPVERNDVLLEPPPLVYKPQQMSAIDKASSLTLGGDNLIVMSRKGFRMGRATHGCHNGTYYFEVKIDHLGETGHARLGWATRQAELHAPVGYDDHSYAYRDIAGSKVHLSFREKYGQRYGEGDVIGCLLHLGEGGRPLERTHADVVGYKGKAYVKEEEVDPKDLPQELEESFVGFSKNGEFQGIAYRKLKEGVYYPAVSLYTSLGQQDSATVIVNFGPDFLYPPPEIEGCPPAEPASILAGSPENPVAATLPEGMEEEGPRTEEAEQGLAITTQPVFESGPDSMDQTET